jgi:hypothetical protein
MEKSEMMLRYEQETGRKSVRGITDGFHDVWFDIWHYQYLQWLEAKAEAYDRLMSGIGKMSMQEWANFLDAPVTLDRDGKVKAHYSSPVRYSEEEGWWYNPHNQRFEIPRHLVDTYGCWPHLSIKYPDGWEEA